MIPREYQRKGKEAIYDYFTKNDGNPIVAMPTGTGKSIVIGDFTREACWYYPTQRIMMLTHVKELIEQNFDKLLRMWPTAPAGIYSAGLKRRDTHCRITFAGIGSVANKAELFGHIDLIIIDECHLVSPKAETQYRKFIHRLKEVNPYLKVIGFTATPYRLGLGLLTDGGLFTDVCYDITKMDAFNKLIEEGYLSPLIPKRTGTEYDVSQVKIQGGEFVQKELQLSVDKEQLTYAAVDEMMQVGHDRHHWLIFAAGIEHAAHVRDMLESRGISAVSIDSKMGSAERDAGIAGFKSGKYRAAINNNVLTTGFDFPEIDMIGCVRPTNSPGLWVQMLGRGTRPVYADGFDLLTAPGRLAAIEAGPKQDCLVLDFAGNTKRLGPINDPVIPRAKGKKGGGTAPVKLCEVCDTYNHASVRICIQCGYEFPKQIKIHAMAFTDELIAKKTLPQVETFKVDRVVYKEHRKQGRPPSIQIDYFCGLRFFKEWLCLEHEGFARRKAKEMWQERAVTEPPATTADALTRLAEMKTPSSIRVWVNKKYPEVMGHEYATDEAS